MLPPGRQLQPYTHLACISPGPWNPNQVSPLPLGVSRCMPVCPVDGAGAVGVSQHPVRPEEPGRKGGPCRVGLRGPLPAPTSPTKQESVEQGPESHIYPHTHENEVTRGYMHMHGDERRDRRMHTDMCTQTHTHAKPHIDTHAHTGTHTHTHAHTKPHIDLCTHKTTHTSVHMHTHKPHIDLHTQTHKTTHRPAHTHSYVMASLATVVG